MDQVFNFFPPALTSNSVFFSSFPLMVLSSDTREPGLYRKHPTMELHLALFSLLVLRYSLTKLSGLALNSPYITQ